MCVCVCVCVHVCMCVLCMCTLYTCMYINLVPRILGEGEKEKPSLYPLLVHACALSHNTLLPISLFISVTSLPYTLDYIGCRVLILQYTSVLALNQQYVVDIK